MFLEDVLTHKGSDEAAFLYGMGMISEQANKPTIAHLFYTEARVLMQEGEPSTKYTASDVSISLARLESDHPGLIAPNIVKFHVEEKSGFARLMMNVLQNTIVKTTSLVLAGAALPLILGI